MVLEQAKKKIMDYIANRDHSELELRQSWFSTADDLKIKLTEKLSGRGKSIDLINQELEMKGLPQATSSFDAELAKAKDAALTKWNLNVFSGLLLADGQKLKAKMIRFLISRGYGTEITQTILNNDYKAKDFSHDEQF